MFTAPHLKYTYPIINRHWSNLLQISISWLSHFDLLLQISKRQSNIRFFDRNPHFTRFISVKLFTPQNINELASFIATSYPQWRDFYTGSIKSNKVLWDIAGRDGGRVVVVRRGNTFVTHNFNITLSELKSFYCTLPL